MVIKANKIKIGDKLFTMKEEEPKKPQVKPPQDQVELQLDHDSTVRTKGHSFILQSGSKFHRDMIE